MKINKRTLIAVASGAALLMPPCKTFAQSFLPPNAEDLGPLPRGDPKENQRMLLAVDPLTGAMALLFLRKETGEGSLSRWLEIRPPFNTPAAVVQAGQTMNSSMLADIAKTAADQVKPTAAKIEQALAEGGLA